MESDQTAPEVHVRSSQGPSRTAVAMARDTTHSPSSDVDDSAGQERSTAMRYPPVQSHTPLANMRRKRAPSIHEEPATQPCHVLEVILLLCISGAVISRMALCDSPDVRQKVPQLTGLIIFALMCCIVLWGTPYTICATPIRYIRRYEPADPLYVAFLMPMLAAAMLLGTATSGAMAPPHIDPNGSLGAWRTEFLPGFQLQAPPLAAKAVHVDLQSLCAFTILLHICISTWERRRVGPVYEERRTVPALFISYVTASLATAAVSLGAKALSQGHFLANLHYAEIVIISTLCQSTVLLWTRVGQRNFTLGELSASSSFAVMMAFEAISLTSASLWSTVPLRVFREPTALLAYQLALSVGMLLIGFLLSPLLVLSRTLAQRPVHRLRWPEKRDLHRRLLALSFFVFSAAIVLGVLGMWVRVLLGRRDPWIYVVVSLFHGSHWWTRWAFLAYWAAILNGVLLFIQLIVKQMWRYATLGDSVQRDTALRWGTSRLDVLPTRRSVPALLRPTVPMSINARRKFFHLCAVFMFVPGTAIDPAFMHLAFSVGLSLFLMLELLRYYAVYPVGAALHFFLSQFLDSKDAGLLILSHMYLLSGCAAGLWFDSRSRVAQQLGTLVLGVGDALASIIGRRFGRHKWPGSKKSIEGTLAFATSIVLVVLALQAVGWVDELPVARFISIAIALASLEGVSEQNDNLVLPICGLILCALL